MGTPSKPAGILLTPGTGAARRKRVSFGHDVPGQQKDTNARQENGVGKLQKNTQTNEDKPIRVDDSCRPDDGGEFDDDDDWEEEDDGDQPVTDMTIDLNEPHSQSGKYWKEEFEKYHEDARIELEKLLKYKQLAKSYAKQRDAETMALVERLRVEQLKVLKMEKMIAENTSNIASARQAEDGDATAELLEKLTAQTTLATQYREKVQQLEGELEAALNDQEQKAEGHRRRRQGNASPATHKALAETQRELRQAKSQLREMSALRDQVASLKAKLLEARQNTDAKKEAPLEPPRTKELRGQVRQLKEETIKKDQELLVLRAEFDAFREESAAHDTDTRAVLERAHSKIGDLKKEVKALKATQAEKPRPQSWPAIEENTEHQGLEQYCDQPAATTAPRRSLDAEDRRRPQLTSKERRSRSLRDKFREDAPTAARPIPARNAPQAENKPEWQEFVPRAPRSLEYLGSDVARRIENGGITPAPVTKKKNMTVAESGHEVESKLRARKSSDSEDGIDLLRSRFAKLGGPEEGGQGYGSGISIPTKINLPPERRAAALARIEKRMAEKKRARARNVDKENIQPMR